MKILQKIWCAVALAAMSTFFFGGFHDVIVSANNTPQTLPFTQNWSNTGLITTNDDWANVPGIIGYLGDISAASTTAVDPRTLLLDYATVSAVDVIANQTNPDTLSNGGVAEFEITNPVVALNGSGTADAPHIVIHLNTTGQSNIRFTANIRDIDGSADDAIQPIDIQYRVGGTGNYVSVPGGFFADVTAPGTATTVTAVDVTLPASANNQSLVQVRVMTTNAVGNDEWVGIDDISFASGGPVVAADAPNDINGDGKTDYIVIRNLGGQGRWFFTANGTGGPTQAVDWGISGDRAVMQDFDGDDKDDVTVWRSADAGGSKFYILNSATSTARVEQFGVPGDDPTVVGDYDGDGKADLAVYRNVSGPAPQQNFWFYRGSSNNPSGNVTYVPWGTSGDSVSPGDYDGDGKFDFVVQRPTGSGTGNFWILFANGTRAPVIYFGENNDTLVPGDYDGDGKFDVATVSVANGAYQWRFLSSMNGSINYRTFGVAPFDVLVPGDYDGDGKMDPAIFRTSLDPNNVNFWSLNSSNGAVQVYEFGQDGDYPVSNWNVH